MFSSVITAKGVTSEPVPADVGIAIKYAFSPIFGKVYTRLRISINRIAISIKSASGCSYSTHIIFAASIAEPPPRAIIVSGWNARICSAPRFAQPNVGSGSTSKKVVCWIPISSSLSVMAFVYPFLYRKLSVTMNAFFLPITAFSSSSATGRQPFFIYTFPGARNHNMFSLLSATVLILIRCFTPTFSDTELPPQDPHPSVRDGASLKLYKSPIPPWEEGVFTRIRHVFIRAANSSSLACSVVAFR